MFTEKENLDIIIKTELKNETILNINKISTGWTNIVFDVETANGNYIFRFPRNEFFSKQIEKDVVANNFLKQKLGLKTVEMKLCCNNNRYFSKHKKIEGVPLTDKINILTQQEKDKITKEIAEFYYKLHNIDINTIPEKCKIRLSNFLIELAKVDDNYYDYSDLLELKKDEENNLVFVHGDLNIGNIILDKNNEICAFIDFAFTGLSDIYCDLSRISCRVDGDFLSSILEHYEYFANMELDKTKIKNRNRMWKYVEEQYIVYMKNEFPEIKI